MSQNETDGLLLTGPTSSHWATADNAVRRTAECRFQLTESTFGCTMRWGIFSFINQKSREKFKSCERMNCSELHKISLWITLWRNQSKTAVCDRWSAPSVFLLLSANCLRPNRWFNQKMSFLILLIVMGMKREKSGKHLDQLEGIHWHVLLWMSSHRIRHPLRNGGSSIVVINGWEVLVFPDGDVSCRNSSYYQYWSWKPNLVVANKISLS